MANQNRLIRYFKSNFSESSTRPLKKFRLTNDLYRNSIASDFRFNKAIGQPQVIDQYTNNLLENDLI